MPVIFTEGPLRVPARERFRHNGFRLDSSFWILMFIALSTAAFTMFYPQLQDFHAMQELYYNLDFDSRVASDPLHPHQPLSALLTTLVTTSNTTCFHAESHFHPSFSQRKLHEVHDVEDLFTKSMSVASQQDSDSTPDSPTPHFFLPPTFNYTCTDSQGGSSTTAPALGPSTAAALLADISTSISILHETHIAPTYAKLRAHQAKLKSKQMKKNKEALQPSQPLQWIQSPPPTRASTTSLGLNVLCHHRLLCGPYNNAMNIAALHFYTFLQYLTDLAKQCDFLHPVHQITSESSTAPIITPDFTIIEASFLQQNPILALINIGINTAKAVFYILHQIITNYPKFTHIYDTTSSRQGQLVALIDTLGHHPFAIQAFRYDATLNFLSTLHYLITNNK